MKGLITILQKTEGLLRKANNRLLRNSDSQFRELERWYREDPHHLKRTDFDFLSPDSIVFDLGGYEGQWSSDIYARYNCTVYIFEPVSAYAAIIRSRFSKNPKIKVFGIGLAEADSEALITIDRFASRLSDEKTLSKQNEKIQLRSFTTFLHDQAIGQVDLVKINIEGAEFSLLESLIRSGLLKKIKCLLIQFHNFAEKATTRREDIQFALSKTHNKVFDYSFVWECWVVSEERGEGLVVNG